MKEQNHLSGIIVVCDPANTQACIADLDACQGVDVHLSDSKEGRIVITLETDTADQQESGLRRIQDLKTVRSAELVYHYFGDAESLPDAPAHHDSRQDTSDP